MSCGGSDQSDGLREVCRLLLLWRFNGPLSGCFPSMAAMNVYGTRFVDSLWTPKARLGMADVSQKTATELAFCGSFLLYFLFLLSTTSLFFSMTAATNSGWTLTEI